MKKDVSRADNRRVGEIIGWNDVNWLPEFDGKEAFAECVLPYLEEKQVFFYTIDGRWCCGLLTESVMSLDDIDPVGSGETIQEAGFNAVLGLENRG